MIGEPVFQPATGHEQFRRRLIEGERAALLLPFERGVGRLGHVSVAFLSATQIVSLWPPPWLTSVISIIS